MKKADCACAACGRAFAGTKAFDAHRRGSFEAGERYCVDPDEDDRFVSEPGVQILLDPDLPSVQPVFALKADRERARTHFGQKGRKTASHGAQTDPCEKAA